MYNLKLKIISGSLFSKSKDTAHEEKVRLIHEISIWKQKYNYLLGKSKVSRSQSQGDHMIFTAEKTEKLAHEIIDPETRFFNESVFIMK